MAAARETTEWEDVQRRFGNIVGPTQELLVTEDTVAALVEAEAEAARERAAHVETRFADADRDQLDEAEDSILEEDERAFEAFRRRRLQELARAVGRVYGAPVTLHTRDEFAEHVTRASQDVPVVAALVRERLPHSDLLDEALIRLAARKKHVKFVRIRANVCIPGYPDSNVPTLLVYKDGQLVRQFVTLKELGGARMTPDDIEWELAQLGVCTTDLEENPHLTEEGRTFVNIVRKSATPCRIGKRKCTCNGCLTHDAGWRAPFGHVEKKMLRQQLAELAADRRFQSPPKAP